MTNASQINMSIQYQLDNDVTKVDSAIKYLMWFSTTARPVIENKYELLSNRLISRLEELAPGQNLGYFINRTEEEFESLKLSEKSKLELRKIMMQNNHVFLDGCLYCKSSQCVSYTHGESVCG